MDCLVGGVAQGAADADGVVVAQIAADFPDDHRDSVSGKFYTHGGVKIVNGFDQADAADLKKVVHIFMVAGKALDNA